MQRELAVLTYSERGAETAQELMRKLQREGFSCQGYLYEAYQKEGFTPFAGADDLVKDCFEWKRGLVFVCAVGIAVRLISPFIRSKETDPAVLVLDETGKFVIPLLSGHLGGANELARLCALATGGTPVITTATDVRQRFAVDDFARRYDMAVDQLKKAKKISVEILAGCTVEICVRWLTDFHHNEYLLGDRQLPFVEKFSGRNRGILISPFCEETLDPEDVIQLIPRRFILGIGCRKGVEADRLQSVVREALMQQKLDERSLMKITTIDRKRGETAILSLAEAWNLPVEAFSAEELAAQEGTFTGSEFVREVTGVDNVCERSVLAGGSSEILIPKYAREGITASVGVYRN